MAEQIKKSESGYEKQATYKAMTGKYNVAMKNGFYFEALMIDYAMLEDRLIAFLWACGVVNDVDNFSIGNRNNKLLLREIITNFTGKPNPPL